MPLPIIIINVHLDDISHANRIDEIKELEPNINSIPNVILGGDFNENYKADSTLYKSIKSMGLKIFNRKPSYYVERPMCIDNIMLKVLSIDLRLSFISLINNADLLIIVECVPFVKLFKSISVPQ